MADTIQLRRDTAAQWASKNPVLAAGEPGRATDTGVIKYGDGVTPWNDLPVQQGASSGQSFIFSATSDPGTSAPGTLTVYAKTVAQRLLLKTVGPSGLDTSLQPILARNKVGMLTPSGNAATVTTMGAYTAPTAVGTATARSVSTASLFGRMRRIGYVSATAAGSLASVRVAAGQITVGGAAGAGFFKVIRFGISDAVLVSGARTFVGVSSNTAAATNVEPSTLTNSIGVGAGAADTNLKIFYGGSTAQVPIDLGANFPSNTTNTDVYELTLFAPPNTADVHYEVTRLNTGHVAAGTLTGNGGVALPSTTTLLTYLQAWRSNNAGTTAVGLDIMSDYIETDY